MNKEKIYKLIKKIKPNIILHLAAQPSAPYANKNVTNSVFTAKNNNIGTLNLLWSLKELDLLKTLFVETFFTKMKMDILSMSNFQNLAPLSTNFYNYTYSA